MAIDVMLCINANFPELNILLEKATKQSKELQDTLKEIKNFKLAIEVKKQNGESKISEKAQEAQNHILKGEKTLNQIREEFDLEPIDDAKFNALITKA